MAPAHACTRPALLLITRRWLRNGDRLGGSRNLEHSTGARSPVIFAGTPSGSSLSILWMMLPGRWNCNGNSTELNVTGRATIEPVRDPGQEALRTASLSIPMHRLGATIPRRSRRRALGQGSGRTPWDVRMGTPKALTDVCTPLPSFRMWLRVHVAKNDLHVRVGSRMGPRRKGSSALAEDAPIRFMTRT